MNVKRATGAVALVGAVVAAAFAYRTLSPDVAPATSEPTAVSERADLATAQQILVADIEGTVERQTVSAAPWVALRLGDELRLDDSIRAAPGGRATLAIGRSTRVSVEPGSQLLVREISQSVARLRLDGGRLSASIAAADGSTLKIESKGSDSIAEAQQGDFSMLTNGDGYVALATSRGRVRFSANGALVEVGANEQSIVSGARPPTAPAAIPPSLFLKVASLEKRTQRELTSTIRGSTTPGAVISVNGVRVPADVDGTFTATVELTLGRNSVVVHAEDAIGREERVDAGVVTVSSGGAVDSKASWGRDAKTKGRVVW